MYDIVIWCYIRSTLLYKNTRFTSLYCIYYRYPNQSISIYSIHWRETQKERTTSVQTLPPHPLQYIKETETKQNKTITAYRTTSPQQSTSRGMRYNSIVVVHRIKALPSIALGFYEVRLHDLTATAGRNYHKHISIFISHQMNRRRKVRRGELTLHNTAPTARRSLHENAATAGGSYTSQNILASIYQTTKRDMGWDLPLRIPEFLAGIL